MSEGKVVKPPAVGWKPNSGCCPNCGNLESVCEAEQVCARIASAAAPVVLAAVLAGK